MISAAKLEEILSRYPGEPSDLMDILHELQEEYGYLPKEELKEVARRLGLPLTRVFSVATFYKGFSLEPLPGVERRLGDPHSQFSSLAASNPGVTLAPKGEHRIQVCLGTACHLQGVDRLLEAVSRRLGIAPGKATPDRRFSLEKVKCLGNCDKAPLLVVDRDHHTRVGIDKVTKIIKIYRSPK